MCIYRVSLGKDTWSWEVYHKLSYMRAMFAQCEEEMHCAVYRIHLCPLSTPMYCKKAHTRYIFGVFIMSVKYSSIIIIFRSHECTISLSTLPCY